MGAIKKISVILIIGLLLLGAADYFVPDSSLFQDYIRGTFTETIGIIATLVFIEIILAKNRNKEQKEIAKKGLFRAIDMINISLTNYNKAAVDIATPWKKKKDSKEKFLKEDFQFNDLSDLFKMNSYMTEGFDKSKVEVYFEKLDRLIETIREALYQVDLSAYPEFSKFLLEFIRYMDSSYPKNGILSNSKSGTPEAKMSDTISEMILNHEGEVKYLPSNIINNYVRLYEILQYMVRFNNQFIMLTNKYNEED